MEIRIEHLSMTYPSGKQALKDLNLELKAPSLIGLLGPNGAGKSTLMKLLVAALLPTKGEIRVDGHSLTKTERLLKAQLGLRVKSYGGLIKNQEGRVSQNCLRNTHLLTVLGPVAGLYLYQPAESTMNSLYLANPAIAGEQNLGVFPLPSDIGCLVRCSPGR